MFLKMLRLIGDVSTLGSSVSTSELCATTMVPVWALTELNEWVNRENASRDSPSVVLLTKLLMRLPFQIRRVFNPEKFLPTPARHWSAPCGQLASRDAGNWCHPLLYGHLLDHFLPFLRFRGNTFFQIRDTLGDRY